MHAAMRASLTSMHAPAPANAGFKRQVVFRLAPEEWSLLEAAVSRYGTIQAAVVAGLRALGGAPPLDEPITETVFAPAVSAKAPASAEHERGRSSSVEKTAREVEELTAREAAKALGLKTSTVSGYIRSGRLSGRYDAAP